MSFFFLIFFSQHSTGDSLGKKAVTALKERNCVPLGKKINFNYIPKLLELVLSIEQKIMRVEKWYL